MIEECVHFYSESYRLEGVLSYGENEPENKANCNLQSSEQNTLNSQKAVLLCSPHPNLGGDMENNVILALSETLTKKGIITLRFNYRGVGKSESRFANLAEKVMYWEDSMDTDVYEDFITDVKCAFDFLKNETEILGEKVSYYLVGYSFGSIQAMRVGLPDSDVKGIVCISTPFGKYDLVFAEKSNKPKHFICSDNDFAASKDDIEKGFARFQKPKSLEMVIDCDHFYRGKETIISKKVINYLLNL